MAANKKHTDIQKGEVVQAVVIADSFDSKFGPLTTTRPRVSNKLLFININVGNDIYLVIFLLY